MDTGIKQDIHFYLNKNTIMKQNNNVEFQEHVKDPDDCEFLRSLTTVFLDVCLEKTLESYIVNKSKLETASILLSNLCDGKTDREIHCLYAINGKLVELEHPVGCTNDILTTMFDNCVFSEETFMLWKDDSNPKEQEGKGRYKKVNI